MATPKKEPLAQGGQLRPTTPKNQTARKGELPSTPQTAFRNPNYTPPFADGARRDFSYNRRSASSPGTAIFSPTNQRGSPVPSALRRTTSHARNLNLIANAYHHEPPQTPPRSSLPPQPSNTQFPPTNWTGPGPSHPLPPIPSESPSPSTQQPQRGAPSSGPTRDPGHQHPGPSSSSPSHFRKTHRRSPARGMNSFRPAPPSPAQQAQQQAQQQQQQQFVLQNPHAQFVNMNGMNGGNMPGAIAGMPTPAGHQMELNYIYNMVDELSRQLAENRRQTEQIVEGIGRVRNRARQQQLSNEELVSAASEEINGQEQNLDVLVSVLSEALEKAKFSRDANMSLCQDFARAMGDMIKRLHDYKANQVAEISQWHRSYRNQLAAEREENARLREQIWDMQESAGRANKALREFRARYEENEERWNRRVNYVAMKQEIRFWKRVAMPEIPDDDPYWTDDEDLVDVKEKVRLREQEKAREAAAAAAAAQAEAQTDQEVQIQQQQQPQQQQQQSQQPPPQQQQGTTVTHAPQARSLQTVIGGIAMQRDDTSPVAMTLPSRPASASSTGSSGQ